MKPLAADLDAVCRRMRTERHVALAVHEKPDSDALGAAAGMLDLFAQLGVDAQLYVSDDELLPLGDVLLPAGRVRRGAPAGGRRTLRARLRQPGPSGPAQLGQRWRSTSTTTTTTRATASWLSSAARRAARVSSCATSPARSGCGPSAPAAAALYAGISFDTGHFHHDSTAPSTFRTAAWLVELGVDVTGMYALLYERRSRGVAASLGARRRGGAFRRRWSRAARLRDRERLRRRAAPALEETDGIVDSLRGVDGVEVAALVKEQTAGVRTRVSLRSETIDVSAVAALRDGGGHKLAAGFSSDDSPEEVIAWLSSELERRLSTASS